MHMLYRYQGLAAYAAALLLVSLVPARADTTLVLTITACLRNQCEETVIVPPEGTSMMACVVHGQIAAADWLRNNRSPAWYLKKYRCGPRESSI